MACVALAAALLLSSAVALQAPPPAFAAAAAGSEAALVRLSNSAAAGSSSSGSGSAYLRAASHQQQPGASSSSSSSSSAQPAQRPPFDWRFDRSSEMEDNLLEAARQVTARLDSAFDVISSRLDGDDKVGGGCGWWVGGWVGRVGLVLGVVERRREADCGGLFRLRRVWKLREYEEAEHAHQPPASTPTTRTAAGHRRRAARG